MLEIDNIYCGDCLYIMKYIDDHSVHMILCDLPYGTTKNAWDKVIDIKILFNHYKRIIKQNGVIVLMAAQPLVSRLILYNLHMYKYEWIWHKNTITGVLNAKIMPVRNHEYVLIFGNTHITYNPQGLIEINEFTQQGKSSSANYGGRSNNSYYKRKYTNYPRSVLHIDKKYINKKLHPTQKPVELFEYLIATYSNENDIVLDNCAGSGTTAVAAINLNRHYILIEQNIDYCNIALDRIDKEK